MEFWKTCRGLNNEIRLSQIRSASFPCTARRIQEICRRSFASDGTCRDFYRPREVTCSQGSYRFIVLHSADAPENRGMWSCRNCSSLRCPTPAHSDRDRLIFLNCRLTSSTVSAPPNHDRLSCRDCPSWPFPATAHLSRDKSSDRCYRSSPSRSACHSSHGMSSGPCYPSLPCRVCAHSHHATSSYRQRKPPPPEQPLT